MKNGRCKGHYEKLLTMTNKATAEISNSKESYLYNLA